MFNAAARKHGSDNEITTQQLYTLQALSPDILLAFAGQQNANLIGMHRELKGSAARLIDTR